MVNSISYIDINNMIEIDNTSTKLRLSEDRERSLDLYLTNLNVLEMEGNLNPLIGRTYKIEHTLQILC